MAKNRDKNGKFVKGNDNRFSEQNQPLTNGRPKKLVSHTLNQLIAEGYAQVKKSEVQQVYEMLIGVDIARLQEIVKRTDIPIIYAQCAKHLLGKDGFQIMENMLDRAQGKATQPIDGSGTLPQIVNIIMPNE